MTPVFGKKLNQSTRGFTMLEMLVVTAIVLIMSGIIIAYIPQFRDRSSLDLVAQEMALNIRSAQAFASGGRVGGSEDGFIDSIPSYGIYMTAGDEPQFFMFTDEDNSKVYEGGDEADSVFENYDLQGVYIKEFIVDDEDVGGGGIVQITYTRPSLQANICYNDDCGKNKLEIVLQGRRSQVTRTVGVHNNGQISISSDQ
ncbi:MAG TPA: prepilin-type N-terminal cleavage/methylation domain-containing protein [Candidatus Paceibacterota bacterium]